MKIFNRLLLLSLLSTANAIAGDAEPYVDLRNVNIKGRVVEVSAPNILKIETIQHKQKRHLWVDLIHVDFGKFKDAKCEKDWKDYLTNHHNKALKKACKRMEKWLDGKPIQIEVTEWAQPILKGYAFIGETNINYSMIEKGWYPVDYTQTRDASVALLEKQARCEHKGIWQHTKSDEVEALKCAQ